ncbi:MAG: DUF3854 domain-containing protein [Candidatus Omnitrophica bacterium]|nr:DUF3854 domain-containing protein [Candidatus Omnitrophota bacterium]
MSDYTRSITWSDATKRNPCPICGKPDWCSVSADGKWVVCRRLLTHEGVRKEDKNGCEYYLYCLDVNHSHFRDFEFPVVPCKKKADPDILDRIYSEFLSFPELALIEPHRKNLRRRGLLDEEINRRQYRSLPVRHRAAIARRLVEQFGARVCAMVPGLYQKDKPNRPYWSFAGQAGLLIPVRDRRQRITALKVRADDDNAPRYSYVSSAKHDGPGPGAQVHMSSMEGVNPIEVRLTEGELKADASTFLSGILTLSIPGASQWPLALPVLEELKAQTVRLAFDADYRTNPHVARALFQTYESLKQEGYEIRIESWDEQDGKGIDDALANGADIRYISPEEIHKCMSDLQDAPGAPDDSPQELDPLPYRETPKGIVYIQQVKGGESSLPLCNFNARIIEEIECDDGLESLLSFLIEGKNSMGMPLPRIEIPSDEYAYMNWVTEYWGSRAIIMAGFRIKEHLRTAIQMLSENVKRRTLYMYTGWKRIGGQWMYLHNDGAVGTVGPKMDIHILLDSRMKHYSLPDPPPEEEAKEAVRASLQFLDIAPLSVSTPLLAGAYLAPLSEAKPIDFSIFLAGQTGSQKSELSAMIQAHYGPSFNSRCLPGNWSATANALEKMAFQAKDAVMVVDDFSPTGTKSDIDRLHRDADRLLRAQGNRSGRGRMKIDASLRPEYYPRGLILSSGEDLPKGESLRSRMLILEIRPGEVDLNVLSRMQERARKGILSAAMSGYIQWLAGSMDQLQQELPERQTAWRDRILQNAPHARTPDIMASLLVGWEMFMEYAIETGAIDDQERSRLHQQAVETFMQLLHAQKNYLEDEEIHLRFLSLVNAALDGGYAHLADIETGGEPVESPGSWGWKQVSSTDGYMDKSVWKPQGRAIGWIEWKDEEHSIIYLEPDAAFACLQRLAKEQDKPITISQRTMWKRLKEKGLMAYDEETHKRNSVRKVVQGRRKNVFPIFIYILSSICGPTGPTAPFDEKAEENDGFCVDQLPF